MPSIAPLPEQNTRITPVTQDPMEGDILTTHHSGDDTKLGPADAKPPVVQNDPTSVASKPASYQPKVPFGHAEPTGPAVPSGPHTTVAVPVVDVDAVEATEAAPPTPPAAGENPVEENPEEPTELTAPIFESGGINYSRKIIVRLLNKVTGQSQLISFKPGESTKVGQLQITAVNCQASSPKSQMDYAGLLNISEQKPGEKVMKELFHGWMYASSPSITALEHPIYDVSMVECAINTPAPKKETPVEAQKSLEKPSGKMGEKSNVRVRSSAKKSK